MVKKITLQLKGMHCTSCSLLIDAALEDLPGVIAAKSNYVTQRVEVEFDPGKVDTRQMVAAIKSEGYEVSATI